MNNVEKVMTGFYTDYTENEENTNNNEIKENEYSFEFYINNIKMTTKIAFVENVVSNIIIDENYYPMLRDMIFDIMLIQYFTDIDVSKVIKEGIDSIENYLSSNNIVDIIKANMDIELFTELNDSVDLNIEYKTGIHNNDISRSINNLLKTFEEKVKNIDTNAMMDLAQQLSNMSGDLSPENIIEAYTNTDVFKNNQSSVIDAKNEEIKELKKENKELKENK